MFLPSCLFMWSFVLCVQTAPEASVPDGEEPEPDASAAFLRSTLSSQHPRLQSDLVLHLRALQQGGHASLQLHLWKRNRKWDLPGQQNRQHPGVFR